MENATSNEMELGSGLIALNKWLSHAGVDPVTAWRWRRNNWLKTININGRVYVSPEAISEFTRRAESGEFAKAHKAPAAKGGAS